MKTDQMNQIEVSNLMNGNKKAILNHADKRYMLSITKRGKLILTAAEKTEVTQHKKVLIQDALAK